MIGITNVGGGGGMAYAYIGVVYDAGATVTCTDGNKTYRAKDTSGLYVFPVPYAATWIVTATDGTNTKSESVVIGSLWQDVVVDIGFWDGTLFDNGNQYEQYTGGWISDSNWRPSGSSSGGSFSIDGTVLNLYGGNSTATGVGGRILNPIDVTNAVSITTVVESVTGSGYVNPMCMSENDTSPSSFGGILRTGTTTLDISSLSGKYYFGYSIKTYTARISYSKINYE